MQKPSINAGQLREALLSRGISLNPPASSDTLGALARWSDNPLHPDLLAVLNQFDGFVEGDFDARSFVSVWPVAKALAHSWTCHPTLAFSDHAFEAFIFGFDPSAGAPIISIEDGKLVAPSYADFWSSLLANELP
jgi:hypothetical protein